MSKRTYLFALAASVVSGLLAVGCQKERAYEGMQIVAEGFGSGHKVAVEGTASYWVGGESVRLNGVDLNVSVSDGDAYLSGVAQANVYRAIYPSSLNGSAALDGDVVSVTLPATYPWFADGNGRQVLHVPLAGRGTSSERLFLRHITSAINVKITNYYGFTVKVTDVTVSSLYGSKTYRLCGPATVTLANDDLTVNPVETDEATDRQVQILFGEANGAQDLEVLAGETKSVQVPVLPVGEGNKFTVSVTVQKVGDANVTKTMVRTQGTGGPLPRKKLADACDTVGGLFSVAANKKVIISQGNLQYIGSASTPYWKFADHQYDYFGSTTGQDSDATNKDRDLFGWGTSGWNNGNTYYQPYSTANLNTSNTGYGYGPKNGTRCGYNLTDDYANSDWGHNEIVNGGNRPDNWYTPTIENWKYLFMTRTNYASKYGFGTVDGVNGVIILPDEGFIDPMKNFNNGAFKTSEVKDWTANDYTSANWAFMEAEGAVFLPKAGKREGTSINTSYGWYWSSTYYDYGNAQYLYIYRDGSTPYNTHVDISKKTSKYLGCAVRLVKDVQ